MSRATFKIASRIPARADALVMLEGAALPKVLKHEVKRQLAKGDCAVTATMGQLSQKILVVIKQPELENPAALTRSFGAASRALLREQVAVAAVQLDESFTPASAQAVILGLGQALYSFDRYKKTPAKMPKITIGSPSREWTRAAKRALLILDGVLLTRDLVNTPAEDMGPSELEAEARRVAITAGLKIRVLGAGRCAKMGMGALSAVGRASDDPPRMIVLEYRGAPRSKKILSFLGKGICFDTGGLDLKPPSGMLLMKKDMGGAATLLGAALALGQLSPKTNLRFYLAIAENNVSSNAFRPGDVVTALDGTTIEIGNTDAEGRLVLADAAALAVREGASRIIDAATLTGAAMIALGRVRVPILGNDDSLLTELEDAADACGEKLWRMPVDPEYRAHINSKIAEIKNVGKGREAGVIAAGLFIGHFVGETPWAHLDISPASWRDSASELGPAGATGRIVPTFVQLASKGPAR